MIKQPIVNVSGISQAAKTYDKVLRTLPMFSLQEAIAALGLNVLNVKDEDIITHLRRRAGGTKSYKVGKELKEERNLLSFEESSLKPVLTYFEAQDNIQNYTEKKFDFQGGKPVDQIAKNHPLEYWILKTIVENHAEDVLYALFFGERDDESNEALGAFDGFYTKIDSLIEKGAIAAANGNYAETGAITAPVGDESSGAYDTLVEFIGSSNPLLLSSRGGNPMLIAADSVLKAARDDYRIKVKSFQRPTMNEFIEALREDTFAPGLEIKRHICLGTGSRLTLTKPGNLDFGWNTSAAAQFVDVRNISRDPNEVQYWLQAAYDTRLNDWHQKVFKTNEQTNTSAEFRGDVALASSEESSESGSGSASSSSED